MSTLQAILRYRCPRCREGAIYLDSFSRGWLAMHQRCPVCNLKFEREQGYFIGAMYVSYGLAIPPYLLLVTALWLFCRMAIRARAARSGCGVPAVRPARDANVASDLDVYRSGVRSGEMIS